MKITTTMMALIAIVASGLFALKYRVARLEDEHRKINNAVRTHTNSIRILKAEYNYLNTPGRIRVLANKHTRLRPLKSSQIFGFEELKFASGRGRK